MEGLKAKEIRDKEAGKSFAMQIFDANSPYIATLTKGIPKNRSTDPKFRNPENPDLLRIPTALEHARAKGVPEELIAELSSTLAHEILGQSIIYDPFVSVGELIGESYMELHNRALAQEFTAKLLTDAVLARARQMERMKVH
jgi:DNA (cytosine-5)-methyltransferase 1